MGIIVNGNHRYIASRIIGNEIEQIDMVKLFIDPGDWGNK
jgi:hypothetical protein